MSRGATLKSAAACRFRRLSTPGCRPVVGAALISHNPKAHPMKTDHDGLAFAADTSAASGVVPTSTITRRSMLRSELSVSPAIVPAPLRDQELIDLGMKFDFLCAKYHRSSDRGNRMRSLDHRLRYDEEVLDGRIEAVDRVCREAISIPAKSLAGVKVKARMFEWHNDFQSVREVFETETYTNERLVLSMVCDLLDMVEVASANSPAATRAPEWLVA
jgi:hypothetical protein